MRLTATEYILHVLSFIIAALCFVALALTLILFVSGCADSCSPHGAYTVPAHWTHAYYSDESEFSHYRYYESCGMHYSYYYNDYRYSCHEESSPVYRYFRAFHASRYYPAQYVPEVVCKKSGS